MDNHLKPEAPLKTPFRILCVSAHPDDIEFGVAGSVARWTDQGAQVTYCIVTDGAAGSNEPDADLKQLAATRKREALAAAAIVGVQDVCFLDYPDGHLQHTLELRRDLTRLIRQIKPDRVVCSDPTMVFAGDFYINHPDHRAVAEATVHAVFPSAGTRPIFPELLADGFEPHNVSELYLEFTDHPTHFVDISESFERKVKALLCHQSQVGEEEGKFIGKMDSETGARFGVKYAETFRVMILNRPFNEVDPATATNPTSQ